MTTFRFSHRHGTALLGIGLLFVGAALGMFAAYRLGWGNAITAAGARETTAQVRQAWEHGQRPQLKAQPIARPPAQPTDGEPIALLRIPRLGPEFEVAVVQGTGDDVIDHGLAGHVSGTALPGQAGNFAVAGHRVIHGRPFRHLDRLRPGDPIVVETADTTYTYLVLNDPRRTVVGPGDTWVTDPVPGSQPGTRPRQALLTVATSPTVWNARQRMIVFARLATASPKQPG